MTAELQLVTRCDHGYGNPCPVKGCEGGSVEVLDPVRLSQIIHDLQDEHGHDTRHDIGLALFDALGES